jgi:hypothetical protein
MELSRGGAQALTWPPAATFSARRHRNCAPVLRQALYASASNRSARCWPTGILKRPHHAPSIVLSQLGCRVRIALQLWA